MTFNFDTNVKNMIIFSNFFNLNEKNCKLNDVLKNLSDSFDILSNTCDILCGNFDKEKKFPDKCQKYDIFF